ncbi:dTDP-4-dehydrorhamnose 3,5-epimerase [Calditerrivibrio nitroreducens]|uniref:dTDP-4-dehydrorhamnose 3,5-epimerase n=1 Tax=Calditerrivibrio nitroreducens (strain DSM 19672 / NBRC 101217 / Yu37-1) TaxID=768670 RepID=E4TIM3_CALNY|nr:dTDP-4-dehydrorhamnose 3,5-epimerase [Calditerrivibrio nitroreducens]ADR19071.1 dTDP-4-dehydrorhamnose 3,5-epimerase [Calditerrivibrio nitroreducens DSM 19672]
MGKRLTIQQTYIEGLKIVETASYIDTRGAFTRLYCECELAEIIGSRRIVQINHSCTQQVGTVRGLHFQYPPHAEMKLVRCLRGRVWDVAVDLRANSPTFLHWHAEELTPENGRMIIIPEGFAHGFQVLEAASELLYLHTAYYAPSAEAGFRYDDPCLGIKWPLPVSELSPRDANHPLLKPDFSGIAL